MNLIKDTLYGKYIEERLGAKILESEEGFIVYSVNNEECFILEMKIENKRKGIGRKFISDLSEIAKAAGCKYLAGSIDLKTSGSSNALLSAMLVGFEPKKTNNNHEILIIKIIGDS